MDENASAQGSLYIYRQIGNDNYLFCIPAAGCGIKSTMMECVYLVFFNGGHNALSRYHCSLYPVCL